jgi:cation:H+ antiporter
MTLPVLVFFVIGLVFLILGAELLVRGAARLAVSFGVAPLVIGLTVVAFGTSAPELAVSVQSAFQGQTDIAIGNVVGSNVFNILLILGLAAAITPLVVDQQLVRLDVPLMILASGLTYLFAWNGTISRLEGGFLFLGVIAYTTFQIVQSRRAQRSNDSPAAVDPELGDIVLAQTHWAINLLYVVAGIGLLVLGSRWLVEGAVAIAQAFGISQLIIGLTIVAGGTSLPEVATSVVAAIRGQRDIAVGNVVGSNLFNLLAVLGFTGLVAPNGIPVSPEAIAFDFPVMIVIAVACLPIFFTGYLIARWEGWLFLAYYIFYTIYLVLRATQNAILDPFTDAILFFVLPLTVITLAIALTRDIKQKRVQAERGS